SLKANQDGEVTLNFTMPEALTRWKLMLLALGQGAQSGLLTTTVITQKDLMIEPNLPRFLTQGDQLVLAAKVSNLSETDLDVHVEIQIHRAWDQKDLGQEFGLKENQKVFIK